MTPNFPLADTVWLAYLAERGNQWTLWFARNGLANRIDGHRYSQRIPSIYL